MTKKPPKGSLLVQAGAPTVALLVGAALYLGRGVTRAEAALGLEAPMRGVRAVLGPLVRALPSWIQDAGPDAAWSFALGSVLTALAGSTRSGLAWLAAGFALAVGYELAQAWRIVPGTFDVLDLIAIIVAYALAVRSRVVTRHPVPEGTTS